MNTIAVDNLHKSFGPQVVLDGLSFTLNDGDITCILGRSGTGKSVLLKILIGVEPPVSGTVTLAGVDIASGRAQLNEARKKVGFLFQQAALYDSMNIEDNVAFPMRRHLDLPDAECRQQARTLLERVGIANGFRKLPSEISGGMKKRVGLARALALSPVAILADEPTAGLDPISAAEIAALILELKEKRRVTSLVVTHDLPTARTIADRLIVLDTGRIIFDGTFSEFEQSPNEFIQQYRKDAA